jgi:hypothetical protein
VQAKPCVDEDGVVLTAQPELSFESLLPLLPDDVGVQYVATLCAACVQSKLAQAKVAPSTSYQQPELLQHDST